MKRLLLPEVVLSSLCVLQAFMLWIKAGHNISDYNPWSDMINWFLPVLFICSVMHMTILTITRQIRPLYVNVTLLFVCLCLIPIATSNAGDYDKISKTWNIVVKLPIAFTYFILGNILKPMVLKESFSSKYWGIIDICIVCMLVIASNINEPVLMYKNVYGNILLFFMTSLMGAYMVLRISQKLKNCHFLTYAGTNSIAFYVWNFIAVFVTAFTLNKFFPDLMSTSVEIFTSIRFSLSIGIIFLITEITVKYIPFIYGLKSKKN